MAPTVTPAGIPLLRRLLARFVRRLLCAPLTRRQIRWQLLAREFIHPRLTMPAGRARRGQRPA